MTFRDIIKTKIQDSKAGELLTAKRTRRIEEALGWDKGTYEQPRKHLVGTLPNGMEIFFLKPGKEAKRKTPNPHDMLPVVGDIGLRLKFGDVWRSLSGISVLNFENFRMVLTLIYRNAYFLDHLEKLSGEIRYEPSNEISECIDAIDRNCGGVSPIGLRGLLNFLDILGWNEDIKYHVENNTPTFSGRYDPKVGRINTLLTCIRVPYQGSLFASHCLDKIDNKKSIDFSLLYNTMQQFAKSRGTCTPTRKQLVEWLSPYVE